MESDVATGPIAWACSYCDEACVVVMIEGLVSGITTAGRVRATSEGSSGIIRASSAITMGVTDC